MGGGGGAKTRNASHFRDLVIFIGESWPVRRPPGRKKKEKRKEEKAGKADARGTRVKPGNIETNPAVVNPQGLSAWFHGYST